jgi:hypothetical protein
LGSNTSLKSPAGSSSGGDGYFKGYGQKLIAMASPIMGSRNTS